MTHSIYQDIAMRTGGNIYIGVVGPVRTGKSTFIKRVMEQVVIPKIDNAYRRERARDELPQSGSGKTIMTAEPKFVPEEAVEISPDGTTKFSVRMIDSVGYMVPGAIGTTEDGSPRMVDTSWFDHPIPLSEAAEIGTRKVIQDHSSIGIVVTTDGTITDLPRENYREAEHNAITEMQRTGKPFTVLVNSKEPDGEAAQRLVRELSETYHVGTMAVDCMTMGEQELIEVLTELLMEFPLSELHFYLPRWVEALNAGHPLKKELYASIREASASAEKLRDAEGVFAAVGTAEHVQGYRLMESDLGMGIAAGVIDFPDALFYEVLSEKSGFTVRDDGDLMKLLQELSVVKKEYDRVANALQEVQATGYGIVMPTPDQMHLEVPEIVRKGGSYGVKLKASAPSIHMMRADIKTEISPMVGDEKQSQELINFLLGEYKDNTEKLWESNIFGKSLFELVNEGLSSKLLRMPENARFKIKDTLARIINEGSNGLICIIL